MRRKILIVGHSAVLYTGFAEVIRNIFNQLLNDYSDQFEVVQLGLLHISAVASVPWSIIPTMTVDRSGTPSLDPEDINGCVSLPRLIIQVKPDIVFLYNEPEPLIEQLEVIGCRVRTVAYVKIDGIGVSERYRGLLLADRIVATSQFSMKILLEALGHYCGTIDWIYAPADTERFVPLQNDHRNEMRQSLLPITVAGNAIILGWVGRNQWRKQVWLNYCLIAALRFGRYMRCDKCGKITVNSVRFEFCPRCGSNDSVDGTPDHRFILWLHLPTGKYDRGDWDLEALERHYGLQEGVDLFYTPGCDHRAHIPSDVMPSLVQCFDIFLFLSGGEGFGVAAWEAMCCGIPIVYSNYSAHAEFLGAANAGIPVGGILQPSPPYSVLRHIAHVEEAIEAVLSLESPVAREEIGGKGRRFVLNFDMYRTSYKWKNLFNNLLEPMEFRIP